MQIILRFITNSAPQASLDGLPDNILLAIMGLLGVHSLINLSRVSRRFHHLHGDESIWSDVDLTHTSLGRRLDARKLKKVIHTYLPSSLWRIKLSSNSQSISSKNAIVTEALLNDLFTLCPMIETITLHRCDLTNVSPTPNPTISGTSIVLPFCKATKHVLVLSTTHLEPFKGAQ